MAPLSHKAIAAPEWSALFEKSPSPPPYSEWLVNQHRDSFASYIGHPNLVEFFAIAENESKARVKFNFLQVHKGLPQLLYVYV